jgi:AcrR family transcriptional regulator
MMITKSKLSLRNPAQRCSVAAVAMRRGDARAVILDAARHEFASSGYAATNMESVARRAG